MPPVRRDDPYPAYNFQVIVTGVSNDGKAVSGSFSEASGLEVEVPPILYRNGSEDITQRKIPGLKKFTDITLKRGITGDVDFWKWIVNALNGQVQRVSGAIVLLDENRQRGDALEVRPGVAVQVHRPDDARGQQRDRDGDPRDLHRVEPDRYLIGRGD